ncbi:unnamed protein product [Closterium sp. NIES-64]|nr:unnamed protein product [Closterium sp. NIES-64]
MPSPFLLRLLSVPLPALAPCLLLLHACSCSMPALAPCLLLLHACSSSPSRSSHQVEGGGITTGAAVSVEGEVVESQGKGQKIEIKAKRLTLVRAWWVAAMAARTLCKRRRVLRRAAIATAPLKTLLLSRVSSPPLSCSIFAPHRTLDHSPTPDHIPLLAATITSKPTPVHIPLLAATITSKPTPVHIPLLAATITSKPTPVHIPLLAATITSKPTPVHIPLLAATITSKPTPVHIPLLAATITSKPTPVHIPLLAATITSKPTPVHIPLLAAAITSKPTPVHIPLLAAAITSKPTPVHIPLLAATITSKPTPVHIPLLAATITSKPTPVHIPLLAATITSKPTPVHIPLLAATITSKPTPVHIPLLAATITFHSVWCLEYTAQCSGPDLPPLVPVSRVRSALAQASHRFFQSHGFVWVASPIITASDCEGAGDQFRVTTLIPGTPDASTPVKAIPTNKDGSVDWSQDFFKRPAYLTVSGQLNAEIYACALHDVYTFGPTFRAENSNTSRHLAEFWMIEPELAFADLADDMACATAYLKYILQEAMSECAEDFRFFDKFVEPGIIQRLTSVVESEFEHVPYTDAISILKKAKTKFDYPVEWGIDLQSEHERYLTEKAFKNRPIIVTDYPKDIKAFYMRLNDDGKTVAAMDVVVPRVGELIGGSQREERLEVLEGRMRDVGLDPQAYWWYLDLRRYGSVPHAGFGLGFERLVQFATGVENIRDAIPFPRVPGSADF